MVTTVEFFSAAARGNLDKIKQGLNEGIDVNVKDRGGKNALHKAASKGQEGVAKILIASGVSLDAQDGDGNTPMHLAAEGGYVTLISLLMNAGADPLIKNQIEEIPLKTGIEYGKSDVKEFFIEYKSSKENQRLLHLAAIKKDYEILSYIITLISGDKAIINAKDSQGYNALHFATKMDFEAGAIGLLDAGIDINAKDNKGNTPLHIALELFNPKPLLTLLVNKGADFTVKNDDGQIPLHLASSKDNLDVFNIVLSQSLDINAKDNKGMTPLYLAASKGLEDIVNLIINKKADVNLSNIEGNTPIHIAALEGYLAVVYNLIKNNADLSTKNNKKRTSLHLASLGGNLPVVKLLLEAKADINAKDNDKETPFELAIKRRGQVTDKSKKDNLEKVIEYLVKSQQGINQGTMLHSAVSEGNMKLVRLLLKEKADVDAKDKNLKTPLHYSTNKGDSVIGGELLKSNATVDVQDLYGNTPLYIASGFNSTTMVYKLIQYRANVDLSNVSGRTPLHQSASKGYFDITTVLLNANANVNVQDKDYNTPLSEAQKGNHTMVAELLIQRGAKVDILFDGKAALHRAVEDGDETVVRQIIEQNGNINVPDYVGQTPLHYASYRGNKVMVNLLLDLGAIPDIEDNLGRTPFDLALESQLDTKSVLDLFIKYRDKENDTLLHLAVKKGRLSTIQNLSKKGGDIYAKNNEQQIPLHLAALNDNLDVLNELINLGSTTLCARDSKGRYPLHFAVLGGHLNIVKRLVELLVDVNVIDKLLKTPLHLASKSGSLSIMAVLIDAGANVNAQDIEEVTPLWLATEDKSLDKIRELKKKGADINIRNKYRWQVLHLASRMGDLDLVRELESLGADVYGKNDESKIPFQLAKEQSVIDFFIKWKDKGRYDTLLHYSSREDNVELVQLLIDSGFDIDIKNKFNWTALNVAIQFGSNKVGKLLKEKGAEETVYSEERYGTHAAVQNGNIEVVNKALNSDPSVIDSCDNLNNTLLHYAALYGRVDMTEILIEKNADANAKNYYGVTPLHLSCAGEYVDENDNLATNYLNVVRKLAPLSDVNAMDVDGNTPLGFAARKGHLSITKELIMFNANPSLKNGNKRTPFELAVRYGQQEIIQYYKEYRDNNNNTLLHIAAQICNAELQGSLLLQNADINVKNDKGNLPLHEAVLSTSSRSTFNRSTVVDVNDGSKNNSTATDVGVSTNSDAISDSNSTVVDVNDGSKNNSTATDVGVSTNSDAISDSNSTAVDVSNGSKNNSTTTDVGVSVNSDAIPDSNSTVVDVSDGSKNNSTTTDVGVSVNSDAIPDSNSTVVDVSDGSNSKPSVICTVDGSDINSTTTAVNDSMDSTESFRAEVNGNLTLCVAVKYIPKLVSCTQVAEELTGQGSDVDSFNFDGCSSIHLAARLGRLDLVKILVPKTTNINLKQKNSIGNTPMHEAAQNGHLSVLEFLMNEGALVDTENRQKRTPLHLAALNDQSDIFKLLLKRKADILKEDKDGRTPFELAVQAGASKIIDFLTKDYRDELGNTMLHLVLVKTNFVRLVPILLDKGASVCSRNSNGDVALHIAIKESLVNKAREIMGKMGSYHVRNNEGMTPLHLAASKNLTVLVDELLAGENNVDDKDKKGNTPLFLAAGKGDVIMMEKLIEKKANVNVTNVYGNTPLHDAVINNKLDAVKAIIKANANINVKNNASKTPLDLAVDGYHVDVTLEIVEAGGSKFFDLIDQQIKSLCRKVSTQQSQDDIKRFSTFIQDVVKGKLKNDVLKTFSSPNMKGSVLEYLDYYAGLLSNEMKKTIEVGSGSQQTLCPTNGESYLDMLKVCKLDLEFFYDVYKLSNKFCVTDRKYCYDQYDFKESDLSKKYDIKVIMDLSKKIDKNSRIGCYYAWNNNVDELESFLQKGNSNVNAVDKYGYTLLDWAILGSSFEAMSFLVDKGSSIDLKNALFGTKPIHLTSVKGPRNIVEFFTSKGVSVDDLDRDNLTPLFYAVSAGNLDTVEYLVEERANINATDKSGRNLLCYAAIYNNKDVMEFLLSKRIDVNKADENGCKPIHYASKIGNLDIVKCLVEKGANIDDKDPKGFSPSHLAALSGYLDIVKYLAERGADVNSRGFRHQDRPIEKAAQHNHVDIVKYLVEQRGVDFNVQDVHGDRTLNDAAFFNSLDVVKYLLSKGADQSLKDYSGDTPVHDAARANSYDTVKYLVEKGANLNIRNKYGKRPVEVTSDAKVREYLVQAARRSRNRRDIFVNDYSYLQHEPFSMDFTDQPEIAASSGTRPSSWINDLFGSVKNFIGELFYSKAALPVGTLNTTSSISQVNSPMDVNGTIMLLDVLIRKVTGQKYISTVDQHVSPLEAQGYALNITKRFEKVVEQAALKSGISMHRLDIDYMGMQKEITRKVMSGKFNEISGMLKSYVEKACPSREAGCPGKLSSKKFDKFMVEFNKGLLNQSIEHNRDGRLEVGSVKKQQISLEPQSYLSNASVHSHSEVSTCLSEIGVTKLGGNINR